MDAITLHVVVYSRPGAADLLDSYETWVEVFGESVTGQGMNNPTLLPSFQTPIQIPPNSIHTIYTSSLASTPMSMFHSVGTASPNIAFVSDENIEINEGYSSHWPFGLPESPTRWNGVVYYSIQQPSARPSQAPTISMLPSGQPSRLPSFQPSASPSISAVPSSEPSLAPSLSFRPSLDPSFYPTTTNSPSISPSLSPSLSARPSESFYPTESAAPSQSSLPSISTTPSVSTNPSMTISISPSQTSAPSEKPSVIKSNEPSVALSPSPSMTVFPSEVSIEPSVETSGEPSVAQTIQPSIEISMNPSSKKLSVKPSVVSIEPSVETSGEPSVAQTIQPSIELSMNPSSKNLSVKPSVKPSGEPSFSLFSSQSTTPSLDFAAVEPTEAPAEVAASSSPTLTLTQEFEPSSLVERTETKRPSFIPTSSTTTIPSPSTSGQTPTPSISLATDGNENAFSTSMPPSTSTLPWNPPSNIPSRSELVTSHPTLLNVTTFTLTPSSNSSIAMTDTWHPTTIDARLLPRHKGPPSSSAKSSEVITALSIVYVCILISTAL